MEVKRRNKIGEALREMMDEHAVLMFNIAAEVQGYRISEDIIDDMELIFKRFRKIVRGD